MARIALKVDVDTLRGTVEGVPRLMEILRRHRVSATFLFSLGPDHTGWALKRVFRPGFLTKVSRTSVVRHYGLRTLMYGVLLPAPDIGRRAAEPMRACAAAGHECGLHAWDHVLWHDQVRHRDEAWTRRQMGLAYDRFGEVFGRAPSTHGAAGWQINDAAWRQIDDWGMAYASDGRGREAFHPMVNGQRLRHVQMPTSLPTFDELIGLDGVEEQTVDRALLARTESDQDQVFTLHAELEGGELASVFDRLLVGWKAQGHVLGTMRDHHDALPAIGTAAAPLHWGTVPGRSGELALSAA
ncbi:MAG: polysaccharide deacetylase family protein [Mitsuaria chitosanitabida]|uniref:polysaccharide deacetylase family protein n=1 Tax=Roseateles chitosanitabidus TaxID=65048 RepID=UPI001B052DE9|nr:polysaccharide deacetylase family protein [Roseateles chitosanitabidus]MBO9687897.1 polysaccharide deacetylase family protein [Roseateles chitosanitabidus]